jgi:two-component sensor histidine kinase
MASSRAETDRAHEEPRPRARPDLAPGSSSAFAPHRAAPGVFRAAVIAVATIAALAAGAAWHLRDRVYDEHLGDAARAVRILEEHAERVIGGHLASLTQIEWLMQDLGPAPPDRRLHERLLAIKQGHPEMQSAWIFDARGGVRATSIGFPPPPETFADRDYFQSALRGDDRFIGRVVLGRVTREHNFNVSKRLEDGEGRFSGVIVVSLYPAYFRDFYRSIGPEADAIALLREDGAALARHPEVGDLESLSASDAFMAEMKRADSGSFRRRTIPEGIERLYTYRRLATLPLYVVYGTDVDVIERKWRALLFNYLLFVLPALIGLGALGWTAYRQACRVDESQERLSQTNAQLEARVMERTQELLGANRALTKSLADKDVLLREVHHRVKNNLQMIASLINMRARQAPPESRAALTEITRRVAAIGQIHNRIYNTADPANIELAAYLDGLCDQIASFERNDRVRLVRSLEPVLVELEIAVPLALLSVELITNAYKHAFPRRGGEISVTLRRAGENAVLIVRDDGVGIREAARDGSIGLQLVPLLAQQINGSVDREDGQGTAFRITFPATARATAES